MLGIVMVVLFVKCVFQYRKLGTMVKCYIFNILI